MRILHTSLRAQVLVVNEKKVEAEDALCFPRQRYACGSSQSGVHAIFVTASLRLAVWKFVSLMAFCESLSLHLDLVELHHLLRVLLIDCRPRLKLGWGGTLYPLCVGG